jgi:hypothetical protein
MFIFVIEFKISITNKKIMGTGIMEVIPVSAIVAFSDLDKFVEYFKGLCFSKKRNISGTRY